MQVKKKEFIDGAVLFIVGGLASTEDKPEAIAKEAFKIAFALWDERERYLGGDSKEGLPNYDNIR